MHSGIWHGIEQDLANHFQLHPIDLPGYGDRYAENGELDLPALTQDALNRAPTHAHWLGWSLGSIVAMSAALASNNRIDSLTLISPTPLFMQTDSWPHGTTLSALENLQSRFHTDYATALKRFLLLQAGTDQTARAHAKATWQRLTASTAPTPQTLDAGLKILRTTDLRQSVTAINVPTRIVTCAQDRVIPARAGKAMHGMIPDSSLIELDCGHAPMIEVPQRLVDVITN